MSNVPAAGGHVEFVHVFRPATAQDMAKDTASTLLLLHGTGGTEHDLLEFGRQVAPGANLLGVRGRTLENGMPRFFRRLAEGVFDEADLRACTDELADFVPVAASRCGFDPSRVVALGYSNGANIVGGLLLLRLGVLAGAILLRPMVPLVPETLPELAGTPVLISAGARDPMVPPTEAERLAALLRRSGAAVTLATQPAGHNLTTGDIQTAQEWARVAF